MTKLYYQTTIKQESDKQYKKGNGYTNLLNHLRRNHEDYEQDAL
ncbi:hypothetical protein F443_14593 [Phytophthora nicotianae P1569]|uniref:BED-type domain-containing protein n=1 Tax=Phytophthora nicotianae P1569 TaxID=1317065 RepID=V9EKZ2_PHYNI|nr:hypothetical protein F443_14593 [Phytophthora nicotianae P1569]